MAAQSSRAHVPKLCSRCGAFYQDLTSQTCPQCFAKLELLSDEEAASLIAQQEARSRDPECIQHKTVEDEKFKEQSFGACLGVAVIVALMLVVSIVFVVVAAHRHHTISAPAPISAPLSRSPLLPPGFDAVIPTNIARLSRTSADAELAIPGTVTRIYHGVYGKRAQVFAVAGVSLTESQLSAFRLAASFAAQQHQPPYAQQEVATRTAHYIVIGPDDGETRAIAAALPK